MSTGRSRTDAVLGRSPTPHIIASHPVPAQRDRVLLELMDSPDARQIDGLGGADPLTSKVAIIGRSSRPGIDLEYESVEVGITKARVKHGLMCGNLLSGVGYFDIAEGLIKPQAPVTTVNIYCVTNGKTIVAKVPVNLDGGLTATGANKDSLVRLLFCDPGGASTGGLLPAGQAVSRLTLENGSCVEASIVDAGVLYIFVRADSLGLNGHKDALTLDANTAFRASVEWLRARAAALINEHRGPRFAPLAPSRVKVAIVAPPASGDGKGEGKADIIARVINREKVHKAYAVSGGICLAAAAAIPQTLVHGIVRPQGAPFRLRIGHPSGALVLHMHWSGDPGAIHIQAAEIQRSARIIMRGTSYLSGGVQVPTTGDFSLAQLSKAVLEHRRRSFERPARPPLSGSRQR